MEHVPACMTGQVFLLVGNTTEYYLGAMLAYLVIKISDTFGWLQGTYLIQIRASVLISVFHSVHMNMYKYMKLAHKHKCVQIVLIHIRVDICVLMVSQIAYIIA